jgi:hypothetical protein
MNEQTAMPPPPYFAFKTLTNTIEKMEEHGPPPRIDRTFLPGMSGAGQTQFLAGLKSLGLIDDNGVVQQMLVDLVNDPDHRRALIGQMLRERYPEAVKLGEGNATTGQLVEVFNGYGVQGDTARKAIAFYLQAAKYAEDIPLSPHFKTPSVKPSGGGTRKRPKKPHQTDQPPIEQEVANGVPSSLHPALAGLLAMLPKQGGTWTQEEADRFEAAFKPVLAIAAPISDAAEDFASEDEGDDLG